MAEQEHALTLSEKAERVMELVITKGDLSQLTPAQRITLHNETCRTLGLNPLTRPFDFITLQGKLVMYARKECTEQLRQLHSISTKITSRQHAGDLYTVVVQASTPEGRVDDDMGVVPLKQNTIGDTAANAMKKAVTQAKRRATLSICGLGFLDETEIEGAQPERPQLAPIAAPAPAIAPAHDPETGEIIEPYVAGEPVTPFVIDITGNENFGPEDWRQRATQLIALVNLADQPEQLVKWSELNAVMLDKVKAVSVKMYRYIADAIEKRQTELKPEGEPA